MIDLVACLRGLQINKFIFGNRHIKRQGTDQVEPEIFKAVPTVWLMFCSDQLSHIEDHVEDIDIDPFAEKCMATFFIDYFALRVHHVVVFEQTLTDTEVVLFHFPLRPFDRFGDHRVLDHFAIFKAKFIHNIYDTVR